MDFRRKIDEVKYLTVEKLRALNKKAKNLPTQLGKLESKKEMLMKSIESFKIIIEENKFKLGKSQKFYKEELSLGYVTEADFLIYKI